MALDPALRELMKQTISVAPFASIDAYGQETFGTPVSYDCYIQESPTKILNMFGTEVVSSHTVYVASTGRIDVTSQCTLPDDSQPFLIRSNVFYDDEGDIHHVVLYFGSGAGG